MKEIKQFIDCCLCVSNMYITVEYNRKYINGRLAPQTSINDCNASQDESIRICAKPYKINWCKLFQPDNSLHGKESISFAQVI